MMRMALLILFTFLMCNVVNGNDFKPIANKIISYDKSQNLVRNFIPLQATTISLSHPPSAYVQPTPPTSGRRTARHYRRATPVALFQGYNSVDRRSLSAAVTGTHETRGGTSSVDYRICYDMESLYGALDINQSSSASAGPSWNVAQKAEFVRRLKLTTYSINIVVHAIHVTETQTATSCRLKDEVTPPSGVDDLLTFVRRFGDSFVDTIAFGSEYYAVYTFFAHSAHEQAVLNLELTAKGIVKFGKVEADFDAKIPRVMDSINLQFTFNQNVAGIANLRLPTEWNATEFARGFLDLKVDSPVVLSYGSVGYEVVDGILLFDKVVRNRDYFVGSTTTHHTGGLTGDLSRLNQLNNDLDNLLAVYRFYNYHGDVTIDDARVQVRSDVDAIEDQIRAFNLDPVANFTRPPLGSLRLGSPRLRYAIGQSPEYGDREDGDPFDDVDINTYLQRWTRIGTLRMTSGYSWIFWPFKYATSVFQLTVTYATGEGSHRVVSRGRGGTAGNTLQLLPGQFVTKVSGLSTGNRLDRLEVTVSDGRGLCGGGQRGDPFDWTVPDGAVLLGFGGRSGKRLEMISATYAIILPAVWEKNKVELNLESNEKTDEPLKITGTLH